MTTQEYLDIIGNGSLPPMADRISYGLVNGLTVMLVVFSVLAVLYLILTVSGAIFAKKGKRKPKEATLPKGSAVSPTPSQKEEELVAVLAAARAAEDDRELIAVITAAISAERAEAGNTSAFRVVSFRRR